jgi:hypothetical protein
MIVDLNLSVSARIELFSGRKKYGGSKKEKFGSANSRQKKL